LTDAFARLDASRARLRAAVDSVPVALRATKPAPDRWSVAEVLEHLTLVERKYITMLTPLIADAKVSGLAAEAGSRTPLPSDVDAILADRSSRRPAPEPVQPSGTLDAASAWTAAEQARADFRAMVSVLDGLALGQIVLEHHRFGALNLYQWVEFIAGHEARHVQQILEAAGQLQPRDA
jgi:hypothetical protein